MRITCTKYQKKSMRTEEKFNDLYEKVIDSVNEINNEISVPVTENRKKMCCQIYQLFRDKFFRTKSRHF